MQGGGSMGGAGTPHPQAVPPPPQLSPARDGDMSKARRPLPPPGRGAAIARQVRPRSTPPPQGRNQPFGGGEGHLSPPRAPLRANLGCFRAAWHLYFTALINLTDLFTLPPRGSPGGDPPTLTDPLGAVPPPPRRWVCWRSSPRRGRRGTPAGTTPRSWRPSWRRWWGAELRPERSPRGKVSAAAPAPPLLSAIINYAPPPPEKRLLLGCLCPPRA